jgi:phosphoenolpyruvate carboxykinase (GTP)
MWPGFGENLRVLEWMLKRVTGQVEAVDTAVGFLPKASDLNTEGLGMDPATLEQLVTIDRDGWKAEMASIGEYLDSFGERTPHALMAERAKIAARLA